MKCRMFSSVFRVFQILAISGQHHNLNFNIKHTFKNMMDYLNEYIGFLFNKSDEDYIISIKDELNKIANILEVIPQLSIEFFAFLKIKKMLFYIVF